MRYSKLFGKTVKTVPQDIAFSSHKLLYKAGFIRESTAGRYYLLPLGMKVHQKIQQIIKEEMDKSGAQEMIAPILHPIELWKETNRTNSVGFELMSVKDRNEAEFVLGGTAEEMLVDLVRKFQISYRDLPFHLYQFSTKFRDEFRARGGLLRAREFVMKDGYSFHDSEVDFKKEYQKMKDVYKNIFERLGLKTAIVESDNGYIGGEYCHEFIVESPIGESKYLVTEDGSYAAHEDVAKFKRDEKNLDESEKDMEEVEAVRGKTMEEGVKLHGKPLWQQIKDVLFVDEKGRFILAIIRGDYDVNEVKLMHLIKAYRLRHATGEEIKDKIHSEPGFISPVGIKEIIDSSIELVIAADESLLTVKNAYGGANKKNRDLFNMNINRDYKPDIIGDIALAKAGYATDGRKKLIEKRGIEVGNIFQLGFHYSSKMHDACLTADDGSKKPFYMGCYGIGLGRTLATVVEVFHDERGIIWPKNTSPYQIHLIGLDLKDETVKKRANEVYELLTTNHKLDVLFDDREAISAGTKFTDCDLIGIPVRLVISKKTGDKIEYKERQSKESSLLLEEVLSKI
ncbi:MAG: proline--tRNA ligase [Candidatus Roizmanbacteria bacterium]|nr:MAG: proline--tRNA ligase [Candidatus Roizmanbacteria bacterium]